ncbi:MAG: MBL fold metallo-hydrolase [Bacteroidetes bacterium]|nr:MBL fold metallo-hydrolase [Bacteroidota bacterium]
MRVSLLILGSGTSQGVPAIGCTCDTCHSDDLRDRRLRPSALFLAGDKKFLIDTSSDFRQQMLRSSTHRIDAVLYTHHHFDHIGGLDDLRQYNFLQGGAMRIYGLQETLDELRITFRYAFGSAMQEGGGLPSADLHVVDQDSPLQIDDVTVTPIPVMHGNMPVLGYRIGNIAYLTDTNNIPASSYALLKDLDVLILDALRHTPHPTHFTLGQAIETAHRIGARRTFFTHIAHNIQHERDSRLLPETMEFSYDGLLITSETHHND